MVLKTNIFTASVAAVLILLLLQQDACQASGDGDEEAQEMKESNTTEAEDRGYVGRERYTYCQRVSRVVNFKEDLGWNHFARPITADVGDCVGFCPSFLRSSEFNSYIILRQHLNDPHQGCCVPTEFQPVQVLRYVYSEQTQQYEASIEVIDDMVVKTCGCR